MTPEQRYTFDAAGFLYLPNAMDAEELRQAREAVDRLMNTPHKELKGEFDYVDQGGVFHHYYHAFAFDKALEHFVTHRATWPIIKELTAGKPALMRGNLKVDTHERDYLTLHSVREQTLEASGFARDVHWTSPSGDRVYCDYFNIFWYFDDVRPGDGGVVMLPGSHKNTIPFPEGIHETMAELDYDYEKCITNNILPHGLVNLAPNAGDVVIASDQVLHGGLRWKPKDRMRRFLVLRYSTQYMLAYMSDGDINLPAGVMDRLSPETKELLAKEHLAHNKAIVATDSVVLS